MQRRDFILILGGAALGCGRSADPGVFDAPGDSVPVDANSGVDACTQAVVKMHDTYAQALYLDGSNGPLTGQEKNSGVRAQASTHEEVAYVVAGTVITLDFWHGHNGQLHRYTLEPAHFAALERGERVTLVTTIVEDHQHMLFIDPIDETYRVPGAPDVDVPLGCAS